MTAILVTRPEAAGDRLVAHLESSGYAVLCVPTIAVRRIPVEWPDLEGFDWVVVTSANGVDSPPPGAHAPRWAAVGETTAQALRDLGIRVDMVPAKTDGAGLAAALPPAQKVLVVKGLLADPALVEGLRSRGVEVHELVTYATDEGPASSEPALRAAMPRVAAAVFASGSAVRGYVKLGGRLDLPAVTIGPRTSRAAAGAGLTVIGEAVTQDSPALAAAVVRAIPIEVERHA